jgi:hypothetical protein
MYISLMQESNGCDARTIHTRVASDVVEVAEHRSITGWQSIRAYSTKLSLVEVLHLLYQLVLGSAT